MFRDDAHQFRLLAGNSDVHATIVVLPCREHFGRLMCVVCAERCGVEADVCGDGTDKECCNGFSCVDNGAYTGGK